MDPRRSPPPLPLWIAPLSTPSTDRFVPRGLCLHGTGPGPLWCTRCTSCREHGKFEREREWVASQFCPIHMYNGVQCCVPLDLYNVAFLSTPPKALGLAFSHPPCQKPRHEPRPHAPSNAPRSVRRAICLPCLSWSARWSVPLVCLFRQHVFEPELLPYPQIIAIPESFSPQPSHRRG